MQHVAAPAHDREAPFILEAFVLVIGDAADFVAQVPESEVTVRQFDFVAGVADVEESLADLLHRFGFRGFILCRSGQADAQHDE